QPDDAGRGAVGMREALPSYNKEVEGEGLPPLAIGVGLHRGVVLAGLVGTRDRMEYACIGRTVNVAARVQALTRTEERDILLTAAGRQKLDPTLPLQPPPPATGKGIPEPHETFPVPPRPHAR